MDQLKIECLNTLKLGKMKANMNLDDEFALFKQCQNSRFRNLAQNFVEEMNPMFSRYDPIYNIVSMLFVV